MPSTYSDRRSSSSTGGGDRSGSSWSSAPWTSAPSPRGWSATPSSASTASTTATRRPGAAAPPSSRTARSLEGSTSTWATTQASGRFLGDDEELVASTESHGPLRSAGPTSVVVSGRGCAERALHVRSPEVVCDAGGNQLGAAVPTGLPRRRTPRDDVRRSHDDAPPPFRRCRLPHPPAAGVRRSVAPPASHRLAKLDPEARPRTCRPGRPGLGWTSLDPNFCRVHPWPGSLQLGSGGCRRDPQRSHECRSARARRGVMAPAGLDGAPVTPGRTAAQPPR